MSGRQTFRERALSTLRTRIQACSLACYRHHEPPIIIVRVRSPCYAHAFRHALSLAIVITNPPILSLSHSVRILIHNIYYRARALSLLRARRYAGSQIAVTTSYYQLLPDTVCYYQLLSVAAASQRPTAGDARACRTPLLLAVSYYQLLPVTISYYQLPARCGC